MIDPNDLRENPDKYQNACEKKGISFSISDFLELDRRYREQLQSVEALRAEQNSLNDAIKSLKGPEKQERIAGMKAIAERVKTASQELKPLEGEWRAAQLRIPSVPLDSVPLGKSDADNVEIRKVGEPRRFEFTPKTHIELGNDLDLIDVERAVKVAGSRTYFLKGMGARLSHALMNYALDFIVDRGYTLFDPPHIVNYHAMMGTSYFPGGEEQAYHLDQRDEDFYLIGTAEVPVCSYHADEILKLDQLPKRYAGYSPCYRREAGTYGKDTAGIYRVHQFYKVEQVVICKNDPAESSRFHAELLGNAETYMQALKLPYRVVDVCTGDMGQGQVYKNDIETWMPGRNAYGETHSCSTFHDFQARRLAIRYKAENGKSMYCHTLNNTLAATTRLVISVLENYQNEDGSVTVPEVLRPYLGGLERITRGS